MLASIKHISAGDANATTLPLLRPRGLFIRSLIFKCGVNTTRIAIAREQLTESYDFAFVSSYFVRWLERSCGKGAAALLRVFAWLYYHIAASAYSCDFINVGWQWDARRQRREAADGADERALHLPSKHKTWRVARRKTNKSIDSNHHP